jgi:CO/xanthine dehydrogenase Mo-binding subunit
MERLLDHLARALRLDPLEVRRRNFIGPGEFPYDTGFPTLDGRTVVYDSGDYPTCLERARALIGYDEVRRAQPQERRDGRYRGVAATAFLESTGLLMEPARVEVDGDGAVRVTLGSPSQGQGHATTLAQVCAARLGVPVDRVSVTSGDTAALGQAIGTFGSRIAVMAGNAVAAAARELRGKVLEAAATMLEASPDDLELSDAVVGVRGVPERGIALADLARTLHERGELERLRATHTFAPERPTTFAGGAHAAVVAVDVETGTVCVERYAVVHDCGTVINPTVVEGQVQGGVAHGIGNALYEALVHDEDGQLLSGSLMDYALPDALAVPAVAVEHVESPSPFNPEGIKGAGEGGTIGALATIAGAVEDALAPFGVTLNSLPLRPEDLLRAGRSSGG